MDVIVHVEFGGKLRESAACLFLLLLLMLPCFYLLHMVFDTAPSQGREKTPLLWAEEKPCVLSVLKFDSEVLDPGGQKANGGGGRADGRADRGRADGRTDGEACEASTTSDPSKSGCSFTRAD